MIKYRLEITKGEPIRYISHLDFASLMQRAICRAHLPAAYSEGFNPHMKISFAFCSMASLLRSSSTRFSALIRASIASLGIFSVVNERLPRPKEDFSPATFSKTRVRQPIVANS